MWRLTMFLLCMIAALSGTPLREAEAADDFARALGELGQGDVLRTVDGGVGDDKEVSILKAGGDAQSLSASVPLAMANVDVPSISLASFLPKIDGRDRAKLPGSCPASSARRFAWLQCFLF